MNEERLDELKELCLNRIRSYAQEGKLRNHPRAVEVMWRWSEWEDRNEVRVWVDSEISTPKDAIWFIMLAITEVTVHIQSSDIGRIEDEIACRASQPATLPTMRDKDVVTALCIALAIMDLRGIEGAAPALRRMATEAYWHDLGAVYYPHGGAAAIVTDADIYRSSAISAYGWTGRSDVEELVRSALASATGGRKRSLERSLRGRLKVAHDSKGFFDKPCDEETHQEWVQGLRECWNNDLQDPQPPVAECRMKANDASMFNLSLNAIALWKMFTPSHVTATGSTLTQVFCKTNAP